MRLLPIALIVAFVSVAPAQAMGFAAGHASGGGHCTGHASGGYAGHGFYYGGRHGFRVRSYGGGYGGDDGPPTDSAGVPIPAGGGHVAPSHVVDPSLPREAFVQNYHW